LAKAEIPLITELYPVMKIRIDKFCFECGGRLHLDEGQVECSSCGALYSDLLVSEAIDEDEEFKITELSVSMDITIKAMKQPVVVEYVSEPAEIPEVSELEAVA
jgi:hypothetical protein